MYRDLVHLRAHSVEETLDPQRMTRLFRHYHESLFRLTGLALTTGGLFVVAVLTMTRLAASGQVAPLPASPAIVPVLLGVASVPLATGLRLLWRQRRHPMRQYVSAPDRVAFTECTLQESHFQPGYQKGPGLVIAVGNYVVDGIDHTLAVEFDASLWSSSATSAEGRKEAPALPVPMRGWAVYNRKRPTQASLVGLEI